MKSVRKFGIVLISALLLASTLQSNVAQAGRKISPDVTSLGLLFKENSELGTMPSVLFAQGDVNVRESWLICEDLADKVCTDAPEMFGYTNWDICTDAITIACIAEIWAVDASGNTYLLLLSNAMLSGVLQYKPNAAPETFRIFTGICPE